MVEECVEGQDPLLSRAVVKEVEGNFSVFGVDGTERHEFSGVDDGRVQPGPDGFV